MVVWVDLFYHADMLSFALVSISVGDQKSALTCVVCCGSNVLFTYILVRTVGKGNLEENKGEGEEGREGRRHGGCSGGGGRRRTGRSEK